MARRYWLVKSEPEVFSWDDLTRCPNQTTPWDGVRNYQARNYMRDLMQIGDGVFFYHSSSDPMAIVGIARVVSRPYPDASAQNPASPYFDPKSTPDNPIWMLVDVQAIQPLPRPLTLEELRSLPELAGMVLLQKGSRLSVQPVSDEHWHTLLRHVGIHYPV